MAYHGFDLLDLFRPGSGMTFRRLGLLVQALPADALLWHVLDAAREEALKPTPEKIRERQAHYDRQRAKGA